MDTIERYLRTLRMLLPVDQRDDIVRELSEEIESQVADKEAALGRALTADEHAVEQFVALRRSEHSAILQVTRFVWLIAGLAVVFLVATSDHQWMVWSGDAAARANATIVLHVAGRAVSLVEFVNGIWSIVLIVVAVASGWSFLKAIIARFRGTPMTAHAVILAMTLSVQTVSSSSSRSSLSDTETDFFVAENTRITVTFEVSSGGEVTRMLSKAPTGNVPAARVDRR